MQGIGPRRAEIVVAGSAVFRRAMETFEQPSLYYLAAGVRDGIIADLAARGVGRPVVAVNAGSANGGRGNDPRLGVS